MSIKRTLLVALTASLALVGCSDNDDKRRVSTVNVQVTAVQQDISNGLIRLSQILTTGLLDESIEGVLNFQRFYTQENGTAQVSVFPGKLQYFELVMIDANAAISQEGSVSRCQWVAGCANGSFSSSITPNHQWKSVVWNLQKDEQVAVTPLTHLAAELAYSYAYADTSEGWQPTGYYSPYSVEQAISQVSKLFGVSNVQTSFPADLTNINALNTSDVVVARNSIRYGALLAAWAHLQEKNPSFTEKVSKEFLENEGQLVQKGQIGTEAPALTLDNLYELAINNLSKLSVHNTAVKSQVSIVIETLRSERDKLNSDQLTTDKPASLKELFGEQAFNEYQLGVKRSKAFIADLQDQFSYFFGDSYDNKITEYIKRQELFFKSNKDDFNQIVDLLNSARDQYVLSNQNAGCSTPTNPHWPSCSYDAAKQILVLSDAAGHKLSLGMKAVADNNRAIDILISGQIQQDNLLFTLKDTEASGSSPAVHSRIRQFYPEATTTIPTNQAPVGYETFWANFSFYNANAETNEQEWTGNLKLLYRGVNHPTDSNADMHFNIDTLRLSSRISDHIGGKDDQGSEASSVFIGAQSSTADTYYNADEKFGKFNGFFTEQTIDTDSTLPGLVSYGLGEETLGQQTVQYFDFYVHDENAQSYRYRFYPDVERRQNAAGQYSIDGEKSVTTHKLAVCPIVQEGDKWVVEGGCSPAQSFNGKRDRQESINNLWKAGAFSYVNIPGKGDYFVKWDVTNKNGCYNLKDLSQGQGITLDGLRTSAAVLGLDTLRVTTEVMLSTTSGSTTTWQPKTLLDVLVSAPTKERYNVTAALSHNYESLNEDDVYVGSGANLSRLILNYNTDSSFKRIGSFSVYKSGVKLGSETNSINAELMLGLNQSFNELPHKYVTGPNGNYEVCVVDNAPLKAREFDKDEAVFSLSFRGVVYGSIRQENNAWIARFIDGTWVPITPNSL